MAQPSTEINRIRQAVTRLSDTFAEIAPVLQRYNDYGAAFFDEHLETELGQPTTDVTKADFHSAMTTLTGIIGGLSQADRQAIIKLRI